MSQFMFLHYLQFWLKLFSIMSVFTSQSVFRPFYMTQYNFSKTKNFLKTSPLYPPHKQCVDFFKQKLNVLRPINNSTVFRSLRLLSPELSYLKSLGSECLSDQNQSM